MRTIGVEVLSHVVQIGGILPAPRRKRGDAFEPLSRLWKLQHRVVVIDLLGAVNVCTGVLEVAPHGLEDHRFVGHVHPLGVGCLFLQLDF